MLLAAQTNRTGAELKVTDHATEGDPIFTYYRVTPDHSGMEVFVDSRDGYRKKGWMHLDYPAARAVPEAGTGFPESPHPQTNWEVTVMGVSSTDSGRDL